MGPLKTPRYRSKDSQSNRYHSLTGPKINYPGPLHQSLVLIGIGSRWKILLVYLIVGVVRFKSSFVESVTGPTFIPQAVQCQLEQNHFVKQASVIKILHEVALITQHDNVVIKKKRKK